MNEFKQVEETIKKEKEFYGIYFNEYHTIKSAENQGNFKIKRVFL